MWATGWLAPIHARVTWVFFQLCVCNALLVDLTVWLVLYPAAVKDKKTGDLLNYDSYNGAGGSNTPGLSLLNFNRGQCTC